MPEEELAIQIAEVDCIEVDDVDFTEPGEHEVFEELAADTACANKENTGLDAAICVRERTEGCAIS